MHRSRIGLDRPGSKIEFGVGCGPKIGPDRSRTGFLLSNNIALQTCIRDLARSDRTPLVFWARSARAASIREKNKKKFAQIRSTGPTRDWTEDRVEQNHRPKTGPKRTGPVQADPRTKNCTGLNVCDSFCSDVRTFKVAFFLFESKYFDSHEFVSHNFTS